MLNIDLIKNKLQKAGVNYSGQTWLVACSGGADSLALFLVCMEIGVLPVLTHVNYGLRGEESEQDEAFVRALAEKHAIPLRIKKIKKEDWENVEGDGIQEKARNLRYQWFAELMNSEKATFLALGHHKDDQVETFFLKAFRSSGIRGLSAMKILDDYKIRPMLDFSRSDVLLYLNNKQQNYRSDSSNEKEIYLRNKIRLQLIPFLENQFPGSVDAIATSTKILTAESSFLEQSLKLVFEQLIKFSGNQQLLDLKKLLNYTQYELILFRWLEGFGFTYSQVENIITLIHKPSGNKTFFAGDKRLLVERDFLILEPLGPSKHSWDEQFDSPEELKSFFQSVEVLKNSNFEQKSIASGMVHLDFNLLEFPLKLRNWKQGDVFYPAGMNGKKKLSDLFIDRKLSSVEKEKIWILTDKTDQIILVGQLHKDRRYLASEKTTIILQISTTYTRFVDN
jgi:tRNA(Ile)-lysidine synthase